MEGLSRRGAVTRQTGETDIRVELNLDGRGDFEGSSGIAFLDHLLAQLAKHGLIDLKVEAKGDLEVDGHHTVEDLGICLGQALGQALGAKEGITRYGTAFIPMDDALVMAALDVSGRPYLAYELELTVQRLGGLDAELVEEFLRALVNHSGLTLHVRKLAGRNSHHLAEALFKALGRALRQAVGRDPGAQGIPSTKGVL
ncbi:MAG: imidazoleglycerol-phosphate dehydratase HisB [Thermoanaerobacteraceae bacterium]|uniref:imidazoleglycerol-phosphate dehydratase HisB n=1 Tax=Thermanaeromonas sp. C210 TaxID=2731925 RepID=UPI00155BAD23|nr:imidazoleglycerol-phosphate dehydratase HisB [Thermanaeromonas sp. C210]MBE3581249.1 imidazoleglycerol-phosphate dehydratase HisB [Thermoanaerobacteraceae bacterium]GFN22213.1 imidazoleglycerol-phosphate dehydratase [Thermanaeromonas sp. C210]